MHNDGRRASDRSTPTSDVLSGNHSRKSSGCVPGQEETDHAIDTGVLGIRAQDRTVPSASGFSGRYGAFDGLVRKCEWLDGLVRAAHSMLREHSDQRSDVLWNEGADVDYVIDWRSAVIFCQPDVALVLYRDPTRLKVFADFPKFALIPSIGECVDLQVETWLVDLKARIATEQSDSVSNALNVLKEAASKLESTKRSNAMNVVATAKRLLLTS